MTDSLSACLKTAYFGAVGAFSEIGPMKRITNISALVFAFINSGGFFIIILFIMIFPVYLYKTKGHDSTFKTLLLICFFGLFATLAGNSISGEGYGHYFMPFIPVMLLPTVWFSGAVYSFLRTSHVDSFAATAAVSAFALIVSVNSLAVLRSNILNNLRDDTDSYLNAQCVKVSDYVKAHSSPDDTVQLMGGSDVATSYYRAKRIAASSHFYYANGLFSEDAKRTFANEILKDIKENCPRIILFAEDQLQDFVQHLDNPEDFNEFLEENYTIDENDLPYIIYLYAGG